jgi:hypothetical protein
VSESTSDSDREHKPRARVSKYVCIGSRVEGRETISSMSACIGRDLQLIFLTFCEET